MFIKIHRSYRNVVALCDSELIGKVFEEGKRQLDIKESFYKGKKITKKEAVKLLQQQMNEDSTFNIVGKKSIQISLEIGLISEDLIDKIQDIPFTMILV